MLLDLFNNSKLSGLTCIGKDKFPDKAVFPCLTNLLINLSNILNNEQRNQYSR